MTPMRTLGPALACLGVLLSAGPSRANIAAVRRVPAVLGSPRGFERTSLQVLDEALALRCADQVASDGPACAFTARYDVRNPAATAETVVAAFYGVDTAGVTIRVDDRPATRALSPDEREALDGAAFLPPGLRRPQTRSSLSGRTLDRVAFELTAAPGSTHTIVVTGRVRLGERVIPGGYSVAAVEARHLLLGGRPRRRGHDLDYLVAPIRSWAGQPTIRLRIEYPAGWRLGASAAGEQPRAEGDRAIVELATHATELDPVLHLDFDEPAATFNNGGVLLGVGGALGDRGGLRARLGYEVAAPAWLFYALVLESDLSDGLLVAPTVRAASSQVLVVPSLAVGLGLPIALAPERHVGARVELDLHFLAVGFVTTIDWFPGKGGFTQVALLGQLAL